MEIQEWIATELFLKIQNTTSPLEVFHVLAETHLEMSLFPLTYVVHSILCAIRLREDPAAFNYCQNNPVVSLVFFVIIVNFGGVLLSLFLGSPLVGLLLQNGDLKTIGIPVLMWFLVLFCPFDLFYNVCKFPTLRFVFDVIGVLRKARNVMGGVLTAESALGSGHAVAMVISGMLKSTGSLAGFHMFNLFCVGDDPRKRIDYNITFTTKTCFLLAVVFTAQVQGIILLTLGEVLFGGALIIIAMRMTGKMLAVDDILAVPARMLWWLTTVLSPQPQTRTRLQQSRIHEKED